ncbi:MAG: hypothetical protein HRT45_19560, partial [Bdellovibrionales bacterium]|nr:hypothetical protein [Bdellovibrionales bacterium]
GLSWIAAESDIDFEVQSVYYRDLKPNEIEQRFNAQDKLALAGVSGYVESSERQALVPMEALRHAVVVLGLDTAKRLIHISDPNNPNQHYSSRYYESDEGHIYFKSKINLFEEDTWFLLDELHFL